MRKLIVAVSSVVFCVAAPAQQLLQCVNPDVLNSLVFNGRPEAKLLVTRAMPDDAAGYRAPAEFAFIGTSVGTERAFSTVAYRTALGTQAAFDSLLAFLSVEGWKQESAPQLQLPVQIAGGSQPATAATLCRNGERRRVVVRESEGVRYATIAGLEVSPPRACDVPAPQPVSGLNPMAAINARQANMPRFTFPPTARRTTGLPGGEGFSGNKVIFTTTRIDSPDTAASLARHLAGQLTEQGWHSDTQWSGRLSTGSTWSRTDADGQALLGTLEILSVSEGTYDVGFNLAVGS